MTGGRQLRETRLRRVENLVRIVEPALLHQRAAKHDLSVADLVEKVVATGEELERMTCLLLREAVFLRAEVDLRKRRDCLRGVSVVADLERDRESLFQVRDRVVRFAEQVVQSTQVVEHA